MSLTLVRDLRPRFAEVRDQRQRPTCLAFAVSDAHAARYSPFQPLSVEYLYYHGVQMMPARNPHGGITLHAASRALPQNGQPFEDAWPYYDVLPADHSTWTPPQNCRVFRRDVPPSKISFDQMCDTLDSGNPIVIILRISESLYCTTPDGIVELISPDRETGTHAMVAVGHAIGDGDRFLLVRNSWGLAWGIKGHGYLPKNYVDSQLIETSVIT